MSDFVLCAPDVATLQASFEALGYWQSATETTSAHPIVQGNLPDGSGSFFMNVVGVVQQPTGATMTDGNGSVIPVLAPVPGYWARLRINGNNPFAEGSLHTPPGLTVYFLAQAGWTADGVTLAPDYVGQIGCIA